MTPQPPENFKHVSPHDAAPSRDAYADFAPRIVPNDFYYQPVLKRPPRKTLALAYVLFLLTLCTCLVAGTQFERAYGQNRAVSIEEFLRAWTMAYHHPSSLLIGWPFAVTLLGILLVHELGHFWACRFHGIYSSYPFFIPFPSFIGTFGAFILIRSRIRTNRGLFDVGASGPFAGFMLAVPALFYGIVHAKIVPGLATSGEDVVFGVPLILRFLAGIIHPGVAAGNLLLHPVGRAAWVGLFATSLNLLPTGQLDGGHILRSLSPRTHHAVSMMLPIMLLLLGVFLGWAGWYVWAALLFGLRFLRFAPIYDPTPLDLKRKAGAVLALIIFLLCFMPGPLSSL
ncbi:MAG: site-2 protease family protein [Candidatus Acidiferrum sp.]